MKKILFAILITSTSLVITKQKTNSNPPKRPAQPYKPIPFPEPQLKPFPQPQPKINNKISSDLFKNKPF